MELKMAGAAAVVFSCGWFGIRVSYELKAEERLFRNTINCLNYMESELKYHVIALPELCRRTADHVGGRLGKTLEKFATEMELRNAPDAASCMSFVLSREEAYSAKFRRLLNAFGHCLGVFDLEGQLAGIGEVREMCSRELQELESINKEKLRGYRTIGFCMGAALAILLI